MYVSYFLLPFLQIGTDIRLTANIAEDNQPKWNDDRRAVNFTIQEMRRKHCSKSAKRYKITLQKICMLP